ncbi:MAG: hypothetical protein HY376_02935 [Candidatus Blackburnbacteria bacterium]|nr:hypothetical protein [Candidatus Blackburnbacteria bacterium]
MTRKDEILKNLGIAGMVIFTATGVLSYYLSVLLLPKIQAFLTSSVGLKGFLLTSATYLGGYLLALIVFPIIFATIVLLVWKKG